MKHLACLLASIFLLAAAPAMAQTNSKSEAGSSAVAVIDNSQPSVTRSKSNVKTTGTAIAPGLTAAGVHSCAGSTTGAFGGQGFAVSLGSTYEMVECNRRAYAATLQGMGQNAAALALVCNNAEVKNALNLTGVACPQDRAAVPVERVYAASQGSQGSVVGPRGAVIRSATPWRD